MGPPNVGQAAEHLLGDSLSKRSFLAGVLAALLVTALATPSLAALTGKTIQVLTGAEIYVDGVKLEPTDANGNPVETFVYNGTTYVPLRAVSQSLGKNVNWDGANQRVYIGEAPGIKQYLLTVCPPYQKSGFDQSSTYTMAGQKYANGFSTWGYGLFNLNGQYSTLSFDVAHIDGKDMSDETVDIYLDSELAFSVDLTGEMPPTHYEVPLHNALQMKIEGSYNAGRYALVNVEIY